MILISMPYERDGKVLTVKALQMDGEAAEIKTQVELLIDTNLDYFEVTEDLIICDQPDLIKAKCLEFEPINKKAAKQFQNGLLEVPTAEEKVKYGYPEA